MIGIRPDSDIFFDENKGLLFATFGSITNHRGRKTIFSLDVSDDEKIKKWHTELKHVYENG